MHSAALKVSAKMLSNNNCAHKKAFFSTSCFARKFTKNSYTKYYGIYDKRSRVFINCANLTFIINKAALWSKFTSTGGLKNYDDDDDYIHQYLSERLLPIELIKLEADDNHQLSAASLKRCFEELAPLNKRCERLWL